MICILRFESENRMKLRYLSDFDWESTQTVLCLSVISSLKHFQLLDRSATWNIAQCENSPYQKSRSSCSHEERFAYRREAPIADEKEARAIGSEMNSNLRKPGWDSKINQWIHCLHRVSSRCLIASPRTLWSSFWSWCGEKVNIWRWSRMTVRSSRSLKTIGINGLSSQKLILPSPPLHFLPANLPNSSNPVGLLWLIIKFSIIDRVCQILRSLSVFWKTAPAALMKGVLKWSDRL
jgi:hypothetical protein